MSTNPRKNSHVVPVQQAPCLDKGAIPFRQWVPYVGLRTPLGPAEPHDTTPIAARESETFRDLTEIDLASAARMSWDLFALVWPRRLSSATIASSCSMSSLYSEMQTTL